MIEAVPRGKPTAGVRRRGTMILERIEQGGGAGVRPPRAVEALEMIGTEDAKTLLPKEAAATLARLPR